MSFRTPDEALWQFAHSNQIIEIPAPVIALDDPMPAVLHTVKHVYGELRQAAIQRLPETEQQIERAYKLQHITSLERTSLHQLLQGAV